MSINSIKTYLTEARFLAAMALPLFIAQLAQMGTGVVDTIMAGRYDAVDLAAIAIGFNIWLPIYLFFVGVMLIGFPHVTLIPGLLENQLGRPAEDLTKFAFVSALGALMASLTVARYADSQRATRIYSWLAIGFGVSLVLLSSMPGFFSAVACMLLVGATSGGFHALNGAVIARETDPIYMGRVMSLSMLSFAGFSLTALPLGMLADRFGERAVLFGMGVGVFALAL